METLTGIPWVYWILFGVGLYVFGLPLLILATFRHEANPTLQLVDSEELPLPPAIQAHFDAVQADLATDGFEPVGTLLLPSQMPNARALLRVYVNRSTRVSAMAAWLFAVANDRVSRHSHHVEFTTRYVGGKEFNTLNSEEVSAFPASPITHTLRVPWITDVRRLYQIHQAITSAKGPAESRELRLDTKFDGELPAFMSASMREELEHAAEAGYLRLTSSGASFVATVRGAYLMTWKLLPPFKHFVFRHQRRSAEKLLAEIGPTAALDDAFEKRLC